MVDARVVVVVDAIITMTIATKAAAVVTAIKVRAILQYHGITILRYYDTI